MRTDAVRFALLLLLAAAPGRAQGYREYAPAEDAKAPDKAKGKSRAEPPRSAPDACALESVNALLAEVFPVAESRLRSPKLLSVAVDNRAKDGASLPAITRWTFRFVDPESGDSMEYTHHSDMPSSYGVHLVLPDGKSIRQEYWNRKFGEKRWTKVSEQTLLDKPFLHRCRRITSRVLDPNEVLGALRALGVSVCRPTPKGVALKDDFALRLFSDDPEPACRKWRNFGIYGADRSLPKAAAGRENIWNFEDGRTEAVFLDGASGKLLYRGK